MRPVAYTIEVIMLVSLDLVRLSRTGSRTLLAALLAVAVATPAPREAAAAPAKKPRSRPAASAFEEGFEAGQNQFDRGDYLDAARTWVRTTALLPETPENRDNRVAIHEYIADAYTRALASDPDPEVLREAVDALDRYADEFTAAYPGDPLPTKVASARDDLRERLEPRDAPAPEPAPAAPEPDSAPPAQPWKGLAIGGGVALGGGAAMLLMAAVGAARAERHERAFDDPANACSLQQPEGACAGIYADGLRANRTAVAGLVLGPLLLAGGVSMLVVAMRRKTSPRAIAPLFGRGLVGVSWQRRF